MEVHKSLAETVAGWYAVKRDAELVPDFACGYFLALVGQSHLVCSRLQEAGRIIIPGGASVQWNDLTQATEEAFPPSFRCTANPVRGTGVCLELGLLCTGKMAGT